MLNRSQEEAAELSVQCCIAGGGPAGMMAGLLLARAGIEVVVLEKHADFLRDFRGDTIHPSTLEVLHELGLLKAFLALPHQQAEHFSVAIGDTLLPIADLSRLRTQCRFIALTPQWDFLDFLAREAARYPTFRLLMRTEAVGLLEAAGRVAGVRAERPEGPLLVRADLVLGADGRHSRMRAEAGLKVEVLGAPMDVLWFRLSRRPDAPAEVLGRFAAGSILVMINRGAYWQCALVIPKGGFAAVRERGLPAFRERVAALAPVVSASVAEIADWSDVKLLTVAVDRLERWYRPGLLCIGDAAHAMSPIGGVGINLAIQDAVAAANLLIGPLAAGRLEESDLHRVQQRREWPTRLTQRVQILAQNRIVRPLLGRDRPLKVPLALGLVARSARMRRLLARLIGLGFRPEHIRTRSDSAESKRSQIYH